MNDKIPEPKTEDHEAWLCSEYGDQLVKLTDLLSEALASTPPTSRDATLAANVSEAIEILWQIRWDAGLCGGHVKAAPVKALEPEGPPGAPDEGPVPAQEVRP